MKQELKDLPDFQCPPLNEVAMSIEFTSEKPLRVIDMGVFWQKIKDRFPGYEEKAPLAPVDCGEQSFVQPGVNLRFETGVPPLARCWFLNEGGNKLIQLQQDRFVYNWKKADNEKIYPRYENVYEEFISLWDEFSEYLSEQNLGKPHIKASELTYVNMLEKDINWSQIKDVPKLFTFCSSQEVWKFLPDPEIFTCDLRFRIPEIGAKFVTSLRPVLQTTTGNLAFRFALSVQGSVSEERIKDWFQVAREWIVKGFADLTTEVAHKLWKRVR